MIYVRKNVELEKVLRYVHYSEVLQYVYIFVFVWRWIQEDITHSLKQDLNVCSTYN